MDMLYILRPGLINPASFIRPILLFWYDVVEARASEGQGSTMRAGIGLQVSVAALDMGTPIPVM